MKKNNVSKAHARHSLQRTWRQALLDAVPFGLGQHKPKHFRDMLRVVWENRDNLRYAWKVISRGVCDGCALGVAGFHDWTIKGTHLCMTRLNLLRLNTMPALDIRLLEDLSELQHFDNAQLRALGRIPYPLLRKKGEPGFKRITWDVALERLAHRLRQLSPREFAFFLTSRGVTNEVYYMAQKVARFLGTNNIDNAARLCHAPSTAAMKRTIGVSATTCSYQDWWGTDLIVFFGANPANDQPVTTKYLHEAKKQGAKVVMVNPYLEPGMQRYWVPSTPSSALFGTAITDHWFQVSQGGDIAFLYGTLKCLFATGDIDHPFVEANTIGIAELRAATDKLDWIELENQAGLPRASMEAFAGLVAGAKNAVLVWSMGITQHVYGADAVQMILNLGLVRGYVGRNHCGLMPIRGHSSVQGGAEMGAYATAFPGGKAINSENAKLLAAEYGFPIPDWPGLTAPEMVEAGGRGDLKFLYCLGGNFLRTLPDPEHVREAMARIPLRVHQDIILTDQMFIEPSDEVMLLPAQTRYEQQDGGTETTTERRIIFSPEIERQMGEARAEWKILRDLACAVLPDRGHELGCETGWAMREEIARVVPFYKGVETLRETGDAVQYGGRHLCEGGQFPTPDGKAHFHTVPLPQLSLKSGQFELSTRRGKQFNTLIYAEIDPFNGAPRNAVLINPIDADRLLLKPMQRVLLQSNSGKMEARIFLAPIALGNLQVHWPEGNGLLQSNLRDPAGGVPDYNAQVTIKPLNQTLTH